MIFYFHKIWFFTICLNHISYYKIIHWSVIIGTEHGWFFASFSQCDFSWFSRKHCKLQFATYRYDRKVSTHAKKIWQILNVHIVMILIRFSRMEYNICWKNIKYIINIHRRGIECVKFRAGMRTLNKIDKKKLKFMINIFFHETWSLKMYSDQI